jgi:uridine kinase
MKKPLLIGIAGGSASGKTTFCGKLEKFLSNYTIKTLHMDDYFKPEKNRPYVESPINGKMYTDDNHPNSVNLLQFKKDLFHSLKDNYNIVIIEGLLTLWDKEIYSRLDLKLYIDCLSDERIVRRLRRNMSWGLNFDEISNVYLDMVRYRHDEFVEPTKWKADIILNGSSPSENSLLAIIGLVENKMKIFYGGKNA